MVESAEQIAEITAPRGHRLEDRVAIITGAGVAADGPIGSGGAIALLFAAHGAKVVAVDVSAERGERTCELAGAIGGDVVFHRADVTDEAACAGVVEAAVARHGTVDALVNNVGITRLGTVKDVELDAFDSAVRVNLVSALLMTRAAAPALASGGGAIVNISSIAAIRTFGTVSYSTSKAALITLTQESAFTLGPDRVRANCILPGHMHASMSGAKHPEVRERRRLANVLATEGTAWDIAHAALFLASDEAAWITGVVLPVDGGTTNVTSLGMARLHEGGAV